MAPPSKISQLPQDLRDELIDRVLDSGFADYDGHHAWLIGQIKERRLELEDPISRSAIARMGKRQKSVSKRMQEIRQMQKEFAADPVHTNRTTNQMLQLIAFAKTRDAFNGSVEVDAEFLKDMALTLGRMEKAAAINEDRERDIRDDERALAKLEASEKIDQLKADPKLDSATLNYVTEALYGLST